MTETQQTLEQLMHLSQKGDQKAYTKLLTEASQLVRGYLMKRLSGSADVEDILQEILISMHSARHTYESSRPFKPWLFSIAKFRLYDYLRKKYRQADNEAGYFAEKTHELSGNVTETGDNNEELYAAIDELPDKQRKIIQLMKVDGFTAKEVAKKLNMSESAVKTSAHRTYKILKKKLKASNGN